MRATPRTRARRALTTAAFFLMGGGLWACDGPSAVDPDGPGIVLTAGDSIPGDTLPPDTVPGDTTTVPPDTVPGDTTIVPPDTVPGDTTGNPGGGQKTSLLVVQVGAQAQDTAAVIGVGPAVYTVSRGSHVVAVDSTTAWGYGSLQLAPGRYTVRLAAYPSTYQLAPGETGTEAVVLTPNTQDSVGFELVRRP
ncbi:MAG TPA: hypothetical protein VE871_11020 [Longimicrobium sp.]|nr:hypothetical protein [Longimicrobium sp.]